MDMPCFQESESDEQREEQTFLRYFRCFFGEREREWSSLFQTNPT